MKTHSNTLRIDRDRLWRSLMEMARIGPGVNGGNNRQALTDEDAAGRQLLQDWCTAEGMAVSVDAVGSMFLRREGTAPDLAPVLVGSHLDTQPTGGKFDGVLGVLAGLEIIRTLNRFGVRTRRPIVIVNWTNEEGTRFAPAMMASGAFAGQIEVDHIHQATDQQGRRFIDELERIGWKGDAPVGGQPVHAYFELHIEQGPILESENKDIGVVTHAQGLRWIRCNITGRDAHTGTTPMALRRDAGLATARLISLVNDIAMAHQPDAVGAVGHADFFPNSTNVVPGRAVFTADLRSPDLPTLNGMVAAFRERAAAICENAGVSFTFDIIASSDPLQFDENCVEIVRTETKLLGYSFRDIISGAGHDACWINKIAPAAMIMCPCVDGISHNEEEDIHPDWAEKGANVLLHSVLTAAELVDA